MDVACSLHLLERYTITFVSEEQAQVDSLIVHQGLTRWNGERQAVAAMQSSVPETVEMQYRTQNALLGREWFNSTRENPKVSLQ